MSSPAWFGCFVYLFQNYIGNTLTMHINYSLSHSYLYIVRVKCIICIITVTTLVLFILYSSRGKPCLGPDQSISYTSLFPYRPSSAYISWSSTQVLPGSLGHIVCKGRSQCPFLLLPLLGLKPMQAQSIQQSANALTWSNSPVTLTTQISLILYSSKGQAMFRASSGRI